METFKFDPNNTEGAYPDAFVAEGTEIKKGSKIVATDLVDLYDVEINPLTLADEDSLVYEEISGKWINMEGGSGGCELFQGDSSQKSPYYWAEKTWLKDNKGQTDYGYCTYGNYIYIMGGYKRVAYLNFERVYDFWRYSVLEDTWERLASYPEDPLYVDTFLTGRLLDADHLYFFSNATPTDGSYEYVNKIYLYTISTNEWVIIPCSLTEYIPFNQVMQVRGKFYMYLDGYVDSGGSVYTVENRLVIYDPYTDLWEIKPGNPLTQPISGFISILGTYGELFFYGGGYLDIENTWEYIDTKWLFKYDVETEEWSYITEGPILPATSRMGVQFKNGIVIRGYTPEDAYPTQMWYYDVANDQWYEELRIPYGFMGSVTEFWSLSSSAERLIVMGGILLGSDGQVTSNFSTLHYMSDLYSNYLYVRPYTSVPAELRNGMWATPFKYLGECFEWLRNNCIIIEEDKIITVKCLSSINEEGHISLNFLYGNNVIIRGSTPTLIQGDFYISDNHKIRRIEGFYTKNAFSNDVVPRYTHRRYVMNILGEDVVYYQLYTNTARVIKVNKFFFDRFGDLMRDRYGNVIYLSEYSQPTYKTEDGIEHTELSYQYDNDGSIQPLYEDRYIMYDEIYSSYEYDEFGEIKYDEFGNPLFERGSRFLYNINYQYYDGRCVVVLESGTEYYINASGMIMNTNNLRQRIIRNTSVLTLSNQSSCTLTISTEGKGEYNDYELMTPEKYTYLGTDNDFTVIVYDNRAIINASNLSSIRAEGTASLIDYNIDTFSSLTIENLYNTSNSDASHWSINNSSEVVIENSNGYDNPDIILTNNSIKIINA